MKMFFFCSNTPFRIGAAILLHDVRRAQVSISGGGGGKCILFSQNKEMIKIE